MILQQKRNVGFRQYRKPPDPHFLLPFDPDINWFRGASLYVWYLETDRIHQFLFAPNPLDFGEPGNCQLEKPKISENGESSKQNTSPPEIEYNVTAANALEL
ncbi:unnamed protein product [Protopolystoma xenopodis]|uniref:Uncharacterized protein n=1 Tax=Protopolystoma xenopodis TaxID=117903 RepID=A0A3S5AZ19_9PLAT|nr:unnamed protein product [Protopolystoma xenopodis]